MLDQYQRNTQCIEFFTGQRCVRLFNPLDFESTTNPRECTENVLTRRFPRFALSPGLLRQLDKKEPKTRQKTGGLRSHSCCLTVLLVLGPLYYKPFANVYYVTFQSVQIEWGQEDLVNVASKQCLLCVCHSNKHRLHNDDATFTRIHKRKSYDARVRYK